MDRLEFLQKAQKLAHEQVDSSSALNNAEYERILEQHEDPELALHRLGQKLLEEAAFWMEQQVDGLAEGLAEEESD